MNLRRYRSILSHRSNRILHLFTLFHWNTRYLTCLHIHLQTRRKGRRHHPVESRFTCRRNVRCSKHSFHEDVVTLTVRRITNLDMNLRRYRSILSHRSNRILHLFTLFHWNTRYLTCLHIHLQTRRKGRRHHPVESRFTCRRNVRCSKHSFHEDVVTLTVRRITNLDMNLRRYRSILSHRSNSVKCLRSFSHWYSSNSTSSINYNTLGKGGYNRAHLKTRNLRSNIHSRTKSVKHIL